MCIARAWFAIVVKFVAGEGAIVIARSAQEKLFLQFVLEECCSEPTCVARDAATQSSRWPEQALLRKIWRHGALAARAKDHASCEEVPRRGNHA
jgi:hypothetical protein